MKSVPWDTDPFSKAEPKAVKILWDYSINQVVDGGEVRCGLFDTLWIYTFREGSRLPWVLARFPGEVVYLQEADVPETVRLAVMVFS